MIVDIDKGMAVMFRKGMEVSVSQHEVQKRFLKIMKGKKF